MTVVLTVVFWKGCFCLVVNQYERKRYKYNLVEIYPDFLRILNWLLSIFCIEILIVTKPQNIT